MKYDKKCISIAMCAAVVSLGILYLTREASDELPPLIVSSTAHSVTPFNLDSGEAQLAKSKELPEKESTVPRSNNLVSKQPISLSLLSPATLPQLDSLPTTSQGVSTSAAETGIEPVPPAPSVDDGGRKLADERTRRRLELEEEANSDPDPHTKQRTLLTVAGYHAGDGNWDAAEKIYEDMQNSTYPEVKFSVERNLRVVYSNQAITIEKDPWRRESLQLELAALHRELGHEPAARKIWRALAMTAIQPEVRTESRRQLSRDVKPNRPALPKGPFTQQTTK